MHGRRSMTEIGGSQREEKMVIVNLRKNGVEQVEERMQGRKRMIEV